MPRKGRKFIDKNKDKVYSFKVVPRSQKDPLIADESAPQSVLVDVDLSCGEKNEYAKDYGIFFDDDYDYLQHLRGAREAIDWEDCDLEVYTLRKKDKKKPVKDSGLVLPSSVFESYIEEPVGMLNKAAPVSGPQPDIDHDIVAEFDRLEIEGEMGDELPDDFFLHMNSDEPLEGIVDEDNGQDFGIEEWLGSGGDYDAIPGLDEEDFVEEVNKENGLFIVYENCADDEDEYEDVTDDEDNFNVSEEENSEDCGRESSREAEIFKTLSSKGIREEDLQYDPLGYGSNLQIGDRNHSQARSVTSRTSHSCSHLPRTELLSWLDDRFEQFYDQEYSQDQWGALDDKVIEGHLDPSSEVFRQIMDQTRVQIDKQRRATFDDADKERVVEWIRAGEALGKDFDKEEYELVKSPQDCSSKLSHNCQSILSVSSKCRNEPAYLDPPKAKIEVDTRRGYPLLQGKSKLTKGALAQHNKEWQDSEEGDESEFETETLKSRLSLVSYRPPHETLEEKRDRKKAVKELRRERRLERRINKDAFKEEKKRQILIQMNNRRNKKIIIV